MTRKSNHTVIIYTLQSQFWRAEHKCTYFLFIMIFMATQKDLGCIIAVAGDMTISAFAKKSQDQCGWHTTEILDVTLCSMCC